MECEIPEPVVFIQECDYQFYEGSSMMAEGHSHWKCSVDNCELDHDSICCLLNFEMDQKSRQVAKERMFIDTNISSKAEPLFKHEWNLGVLEKYSSDHSSMEGQTDSDSDVTVSLPSNSCSDQKSSVKAFSPLIPSTEAYCKAFNDNMSDDTRMNDSAGVKTEKRDHDLAVIKTPQNGKTENGVVQMSLAALFAIQNAEDSSKPSAASPLPGDLTIQSCDCISIRSSSTTSTQSFAFPILTSEFYASPVKMARGDIRFLKKRRQWKKYCFGCCKF